MGYSLLIKGGNFIKDNNNNNKKPFFIFKKKETEVIDLSKKTNFNILLTLTFLIGLLLIVSSYAWFSSALNFKVKFFTITASTNTGLLISLDGKEYSGTIDVNVDTVITNLNTYSNHKNRWASKRLYPTSSNGINNSNNDTFDMFRGIVFDYKQNTNRRVISVDLEEELEPTIDSSFIAFDIFLKNVSGSPNPDNLYLDTGSGVDFTNESDDDSNGIINSMRFGFLKINSVSSKSELNIIQNMTCNNKCESTIFEPRHLNHSSESIKRVKNMGISLLNNTPFPTYAIIKEGRELESRGGYNYTNIPLDNEHFKLQNTITNLNTRLMQIPNAVTKVRIYVWVEGQDVDILESVSNGSNVSIAINFKKDLAGYD